MGRIRARHEATISVDRSGRRRHRIAFMVVGLAIASAACTPPFGHHHPTSSTTTSTTTSPTTSTTTTTAAPTTTTTVAPTTTTTLPPCVQSCDGATLTVAVDHQNTGVWGLLTGTGLKPGAAVHICDNVSGCITLQPVVQPDGSFTLSPIYCCDASRTFVYVISTTAANSLQITSNSVSYP